VFAAGSGGALTPGTDWTEIIVGAIVISGAIWGAIRRGRSFLLRNIKAAISQDLRSEMNRTVKPPLQEVTRQVQRNGDSDSMADTVWRIEQNLQQVMADAAAAQRVATNAETVAVNVRRDVQSLRAGIRGLEGRLDEHERRPSHREGK